MNDYYEEREALIPIGVNMKCAKCSGGYLEVVDPSNPQISTTVAIFPAPKPMYEHRCTNHECDNMAFFEGVYPTIEYDDLENHV